MIATGYVLRAVLTRAVGALVAGLLLYLAIDLVEVGKGLTRVGAPWLEGVRWSLWSAPLASQRLVPVAALLGAFLAVGWLRRTGQLEALVALGRGRRVVVLPLLLTGLLAATATALSGELLVPAATARLVDARAAIGWYAPPGSEAWLVDDDVLWRASGVAADGDGIVHLTGVRVDGNVGPTERWDLNDVIRNAGGAWHFRAGLHRTLGETGSVEVLAAGIAPLASSARVKGTPREADALSAGELAELASSLRRSGRRSPRLETELWGRLGLALMAGVAPLCAIPFAAGGRRRKRKDARATGSRRSDIASALGLALAAAFPLWLAVAAGRVLSAAGAVPPWAGALVPPVLAAGLVILFFRRSS